MIGNNMFLLIIKIMLFQWMFCYICTCEDERLFSANEDVTNGEFMDRLFHGYSKNILPVLKTDKPVVLNLTLFHMSIEYLDNKDKVAGASIILGLQWIDEYLTWNSSEFKNLSKISVDPKKVWLPDLLVWNEENMLTFVKLENIQYITLYSSGLMVAWLYLNVEVGVKLEIRNYPFDTQVCEFQFSSWTHTDREILLLEIPDEPTGGDTSQRFRQSGEWDLIKMEKNMVPVSYDNNTHNFTILQYRFTVKRRWLYTILNLVVPVVLTSLLNPLSFLLPVESGERISLSNTVFLTLAVFFSIVNNSLPQTSEGVPVIVAYIGLQMVGSALTIILTICSLALYHRKQRTTQPRILRYILCRKMHKAEYKKGATDFDNQMNENEDRKEVWLKASNYMDKACFWLLLTWNIVLLAMVFICANIW